MSLPTRFYVYYHRDPRDRQIRYIGCGSGGRAWACSGNDNGKRGSRTTDHKAWIYELLNLGYTPADFVEIIDKNLDRQDALNLERKLIDQQQIENLFNRPMGLSILRLMPHQFQDAKRLRQDGMFYKDIAKELGVSAMTIWRALNGKVKNHG